MNANQKVAWYKQSSIWLLIAPILLVFFVCTILVGFAVVSPDDQIADDYYKQGKLINKAFAAEQLADERGLVASVNLDFASGEVLLTMQGDVVASDKLILHFSHPAEAKKDFSISLHEVRSNVFRGDLPKEFAGRWYLRLEPDTTQSGAPLWRLKGDVDLRNTLSFSLD